MSSPSDKFEMEIDRVESAFREQLLRLLPEAAKSGVNLFTNSDFNPWKLPPKHTHPDADDLLQMARECLRLRERRGVAVPGSVGYLFLAMCEENVSRDENRRGPRRLAEALLEQVKALPSATTGKTHQ